MSDMTLHDLFVDLATNPTARASFEADSDGFLDAHGFGGPE